MIQVWVLTKTRRNKTQNNVKHLLYSMMVMLLTLVSRLMTTTTSFILIYLWHYLLNHKCSLTDMFGKLTWWGTYVFWFVFYISVTVIKILSLNWNKTRLCRNKSSDLRGPMETQHKSELKPRFWWYFLPLLSFGVVFSYFYGTIKGFYWDMKRSMCIGKEEFECLKGSTSNEDLTFMFYFHTF